MSFSEHAAHKSKSERSGVRCRKRVAGHIEPVGMVRQAKELESSSPSSTRSSHPSASQTMASFLTFPPIGARVCGEVPAPLRGTLRARAALPRARARARGYGLLARRFLL